MLLTGSFARTLDEKQRLAIPKSLREALQQAAQTVLFVAPGTDGSLALYTEDSFASLGRRLAQASPAAQDVRAFSRMFFAQAQRVELDGQGRIRLPSELALLAGLTGEVMLIGVGDHMELWNTSCWRGYSSDKQSQYDQLAELAFRAAIESSGK